MPAQKCPGEPTYVRLPGIPACSANIRPVREAQIRCLSVELLQVKRNPRIVRRLLAELIRREVPKRRQHIGHQRQIGWFVPARCDARWRQVGSIGLQQQSILRNDAERVPEGGRTPATGQAAPATGQATPFDSDAT